MPRNPASIPLRCGAKDREELDQSEGWAMQSIYRHMRGAPPLLLEVCFQINRPSFPPQGSGRGCIWASGSGRRRHSKGLPTVSGDGWMGGRPSMGWGDMATGQGVMRLQAWASTCSLHAVMMCTLTSSPPPEPHPLTSPSCVRKKLLKQTAKNSSDPSLEVCMGGGRGGKGEGKQ